jgi:glycosyltransferase involved in cell wall biosynthesis
MSDDYWDPEASGGEDRQEASPRFSVVIPTHNRVAALQHAIDDVLAQTFPDLEVIVVDDGSTDGTAAILSTISDARLRFLVREQGGPSRARNAGAAAARGAWLTFLDDDDRVADDWLSVFEEHSADPAVGLVCCGSALVEEDGTSLGTSLPKELGPMYGNVTAWFTAGAFAVARPVFNAAGGYDPLMTFGENFELGMRIGSVCRSRGLRIETDNRCPVRWTRRPGQRPTRAQASDLYGGAVRLLEKHPGPMAADREERWSTLSIAGVNAARLGRNREAQRWLARAARVRPTRMKSWLRLAAACMPAIGRHAWGDYRELAAESAPGSDTGSPR